MRLETPNERCAVSIYSSSTSTFTPTFTAPVAGARARLADKLLRDARHSIRGGRGAKNTAARSIGERGTTVRNLHLAVLAALALLASALPAAAQQKGVAVAPFTAQGAEGALAEGLTSVMRTEVASTSCVRLVAEGVIEDLARQLGLEQQCGAENCQIDLAKMVKADLLVRGDLARVDGRYLITGMLIELGEGRTLASEKVWAEQDALVQKTETLARRIAGQIECPTSEQVATTSAGPGVLVHGFSADEDMSALAVAATETTSFQLERWGGVSTYSSAEVSRLADERGYEDWNACAAPECLRDIALALGASEFVTASLHQSSGGLLGRAPYLTLSAERRDTRTGEIKARAKERWSGSAAGTAPALALVVLGLYTDVSKLPEGRVRIVGDGEQILVAGAMSGTAGDQGLVLELPAGIHELAVKDQTTEKLPVVVLPEEELSVPLDERAPAVIAADDTPFYKTWWFWTLVAGGAAAGIGGGIAAANSGSDSPPTGGQPVTFTVPAP